MSDFIRIWSEKSNNIVEKLDIRLVFDKIGITNNMKPHVKGTYFDVKAPWKVTLIDREFNSKDDALDHMKLSFDEFIEKHPHAKGFYKVDSNATQVIGNRLDSEWGLRILGENK